MSNGGLAWLGGKAWEDVTREERFFCAELFSVVREDVRGFVRFLNGKGLGLQEDANWELAYEVCFYRDFAVHRDTKNDYSGHRTLDLALFSDKEIVLIEAKAQQPFDGNQLRDLVCDRGKIGKLTSVQSGDMHLVGLKSSHYDPAEATRKHFNLVITWCDLASWYSSNERAKRIFRRADGIYRK